MSARFGPAGQCEMAQIHKLRTTAKYLEYVAAQGLTAFEYPCGRGINIGNEKALQIGHKAQELGITVSLHAPYFISLASLEEEKRSRSVQYIVDSAAVVNAMGGSRIIVHPGGLNKQPREEALRIAGITLQAAQNALDEAGYGHIAICPETMGKIAQLGNLSEIVYMCQLDERMIPCIDFGHLHARTKGGITGIKQYEQILDELENALGKNRVEHLHAHFSKIAYSTGGEVRHLTFADEQYGPDYEPLMELFARRALSPVVICESAGTQSADALAMQQTYYDFMKGAAL